MKVYIKKNITRNLYLLYNRLQKGDLGKFYKEIVHAHTSSEGFNYSELINYLNNWKFSSSLEKNSLMTKDIILNYVKKLDSSSVHSWAYTGGSYGEPLRVPYSKKRAFIRTATFRYYNEQGGYRLGDPFALIRAKNKSPILKFLRNETIIVPTDVSVSRLSEIIHKLKKNRVSVLIGYPTVMYELALYLRKYPERKKGLVVKHLISASEMLEQEKKEIIYNEFDCPFVDRYANEEVGLIAQQKEFGGEYFTNRYGVFTEVVDPNTLETVPEGKTGKVVVTDIFNDLIPVVRYDTGDLAIAGRYQNGKLATIRKVIGRETEKIFDTSGNPVSSLALGPLIYKPLSKEGHVMQFQFAQTDKKKYALRIKTNPISIHNHLKKELVNELQKTLGSDSRIHILAVEDIPPQPSGKRPVYKNEMKGSR